MSVNGVPIEAMEAIRLKKLLYCRAVDAHQVDVFDKVALPDVRMIYYTADGKVVTSALPGQDDSKPYDFKSRDEFKEFLRTTYTPLQVKHVVDSGYFEAGETEDEVKVTFSVIGFAGPATSICEHHGSIGGEYREVFKRVDGEWWLKTCDFVTLYHRQG